MWVKFRSSLSSLVHIKALGILVQTHSLCWNATASVVQLRNYTVTLSFPLSPPFLWLMINVCLICLSPHSGWLCGIFSCCWSWIFSEERVNDLCYCGRYWGCSCLLDKISSTEPSEWLWTLLHSCKTASICYQELNSTMMITTWIAANLIIAV